MRNSLVALAAGTLITPILSLPHPEPANDPQVYNQGVLSSYLPTKNPDSNQPNPDNLTDALASTSQVDISSLTDTNTPLQLPISAPPVVSYSISPVTQIPTQNIQSFSTFSKLVLWYLKDQTTDSSHHYAFLNAIRLQLAKLHTLPGTTVIKGTRTTLGRGPAPNPGPAPDGPANGAGNEQAAVATLILDGDSRSPGGCTVTLAISGLETLQRLVEGTHAGVPEASAWTALHPSRGGGGGGDDGAETQGQGKVQPASCTWFGNAAVPLSEVQKPVLKWPEEGGGVETGVPVQEGAGVQGTGSTPQANQMQ